MAKKKKSAELLNPDQPVKEEEEEEEATSGSGWGAYNASGELVRVFETEVHGKDAKKLAEEFISKRVQNEDGTPHRLLSREGFTIKKV